MTRHRFLVVVLLFGLTGVVIAASGWRFAPEISSVAPNPASPSPTAQWLTVTGRGFVEGVTLSITTPSGAVVRTRGSDIADVRDTSFRASVLLSAAGRYELVAINPDGKLSSAFVLAVKAGVAGPTVTAIKPTEVSRSQNAQTLTVEGTHFAPGLFVMLTDPAGGVVTLSGNAIGQVSTTEFPVTVTVELDGDYSLTVTNASGATSSAFSFRVKR